MLCRAIFESYLELPGSLDRRWQLMLGCRVPLKGAALAAWSNELECFETCGVFYGYFDFDRLLKHVFANLA